MAGKGPLSNAFSSSLVHRKTVRAHAETQQLSEADTEKEV